MSEVIERPPAVEGRPPSLPPNELTSEERTWAALAHASTVLAILVALGSAGLSVLIMPFIPLGIYLVFREKSRYVAQQAAQAFVAQLVATLGFLILAIAVVVVIVAAWIVTGVLSIILIGLLLIPVALIISIVLPLLLVAYPFVVAGLSIAATVETANGKPYRLPLIGTNIVDWLNSFETRSANRGNPPAV